MTAKKKSTTKNSTMTESDHKAVRTMQQELSNLFQDKNPSEVTDIYWLFAQRQTKGYPKQTKNSGKWLVFAPIDKVDEVWSKIKEATENGLLGQASKVSTAKENPNATNKNSKVICVYSYDYTDEQDVMRIRDELREIGIISKIPYKTDSATREGKYRVKGNQRISEYYE